jgi:phage terminase Nu1 subunit (DNA packaging protein)
MKTIGREQTGLPGFSQDDLKSRDSTTQTYAATYAEVAEFFGVHEQTIKNWAKKGMPPRLISGKYDLTAIKKWAIDQGLIAEDVGGYAIKIQREKYLHERAKRKERELDLEIKTGKHIKVEDAKREIQTMVQAVKMAVLAIPHKMAPLLEGLTAVQIQEQLEIAVDEVLRHLSDEKKGKQ